VSCTTYTGEIEQQEAPGAAMAAIATRQIPFTQKRPLMIAHSAAETLPKAQYGQHLVVIARWRNAGAVDLLGLDRAASS